MVFCHFVIWCSSDSNSPTLHGIGQIRNPIPGVRKPAKPGLSPHKNPTKTAVSEPQCCQNLDSSCILLKNFAKTMEGPEKTKVLEHWVAWQLKTLKLCFVWFFSSLQRFGTKTLFFLCSWYPPAFWHQNFGFFGTLHGVGKVLLQNAPTTLRGPKKPNQAMGSANLRFWKLCMYPEEVPEAFLLGEGGQTIHCYIGTIRTSRSNYENYCEYLY